MAVTLVELARLAVFMIDPAQVAWSIQPANTWRVRHSCVSAYWVACQEVDDGGDVYRLQRYEPPRDAAGRRQRIVMEGFVLDAYEYPPPFLGAAAAARAPRRRRSFASGRCGSPSSSMAVAAGLVVVARWIGGPAGAIALTLSGFILAPVRRDEHAADRQRPARVRRAPDGGDGAVRSPPAGRRAAPCWPTRRSASCIPALLVLYLLLRRDWRGAAWTVGLGVAIVGAVARRRRLGAVSGLRSITCRGS